MAMMQMPQRDWWYSPAAKPAHYCVVLVMALVIYSSIYIFGSLHAPAV